MSALVRRRERIARVRRVEHAQAAAAAAAAEAKLAQLETSESRLTQLRSSLSWELGDFSAATLASRAELALRLDEARFGLADAIEGARATAALRREERVEARIRQESATKLSSRAATDIARAAERRAAANARQREPRTLGDA
ncbi:hypothetical protein [Sphingomonas morindae]|uniref:Flagellar FliJ protein n=1 Tax=Sphingomonas morindae TaxID=1541170 RepID=A0ABY4X9V0_9SPHN|nr:hypothetical protein [Sphingomonas morindae]USI73720.1 hypothetical protein LHA26_04410 [Sphingomonas morindae]